MAGGTAADNEEERHVKDTTGQQAMSGLAQGRAADHLRGDLAD
jgi:hypothetical protein